MGPYANRVPTTPTLGTDQFRKSRPAIRHVRRQEGAEKNWASGSKCLCYPIIPIRITVALSESCIWVLAGFCNARPGFVFFHTVVGMSHA